MDIGVSLQCGRTAQEAAHSELGRVDPAEYESRICHDCDGVMKLVWLCFELDRLGKP